jgi:hypothetical protein
MHFSLYPIHLTYPAHLILLELIFVIILCEEYKLWSSSLMQCSPVYYHFIPLWPRYYSWHPVLKHPQSVFFPLVSETKFQTHTHRGKIIVLHSVFFAFLDSRQHCT